MSVPPLPECGPAGQNLRLHAYAGGLMRGRVRRILEAAGHELRVGLPKPGEGVAVWGRSRNAWRGEAVARWRGVPLFRLEDGFLRSVLPGRAGAPPIGLILDRTGLYFETERPSDLSLLLDHGDLDAPTLLSRARDGIARMQWAHLSKYSATDPALHPGDEDYVLVIDQTRGDASIAGGGAGPEAFAAMLAAALADHPDAPVLIKTHPETARGLRPGHFGPSDAGGRVRLITGPLSPWRLFAGARAVYCVTSLMGFEAALAGHAPVVFGRPFWAGRGFSQDRIGAGAGAVAGAGVVAGARPLSPEQVFAAGYLLAPLWHDPCRDRPASFEEALDQIEAEARSWREDHRGAVALGMRAWKRPGLVRFFGRLRFRDRPAAAVALARRRGQPVLAWAGAADAALASRAAKAGVPLRRVEDGLIRSRGLGAALVPPLSLVSDDLGIYYDPATESRLERLIAEASGHLPDHARTRAERLLASIRAGRLSKYNLGGKAPLELPGATPRILVPGQVADDASIRLGAADVADNLALLRAARQARPGATILYKPHPDVEAGLRPGALSRAEVLSHADAILEQVDAIAALEAVDEIWTMTSSLGFEALLRGRRVVCLGAPFYAGWGLTEDLGPTPARRQARPDLVSLLHAVLIAYPRYHDPVADLPCPPEVAVERLASDHVLPRSPANRALARLQGRFATLAWIWRR
ncbi:MAG: capsular polysaccharide biosynthesis protein [Rhodobacteraceae bacterium]|nr:capsular polysaccharide biosynthesis protein [Paracoccaceae bacterium]